MVGKVGLIFKCLTLTVSEFCLRCLHPKVHNFTNYALSQSESYLLSLGLNFRPTPSLISAHTRSRQMDEFARSVRIKHFFRGKDLSPQYQSHKLFLKSDWIPPLGPAWIEIPLLAIRHELTAITISHHIKSNISQSELHTLSKLQSNRSIKILPSDKNLGPTIVSTSWYSKEVAHLLSSRQFYGQVPEVPYRTIQCKIESILQRYGKFLGEKLVGYILQYVGNHYPAKFKILPKVHKIPMVGRPIVASTRYITTPASKFIDHILSPLLPTIPSYVRDSMTFINNLRNVSVHGDCYLVTADV